MNSQDPGCKTVSNPIRGTRNFAPYENHIGIQGFNKTIETWTDKINQMAMRPNSKAKVVD